VPTGASTHDHRAQCRQAPLPMITMCESSRRRQQVGTSPHEVETGTSTHEHHVQEQQA
jgi:hypothetical protein